MKDKNSKNFQIGAKLVGKFLGEIPLSILEQNVPLIAQFVYSVWKLNCDGGPVPRIWLRVICWSR